MIVLEQDGIELARSEHVWKADGRVTVSLLHRRLAGGPSSDGECCPLLVSGASSTTRLTCWPWWPRGQAASR